MAVEPVITKEESPKKSMLGSIGFGGKEGKPKKEKKVKEKKVKNNAGSSGDDDNDDSSVCSTTSNGEKNWLGLEKKNHVLNIKRKLMNYD